MRLFGRFYSKLEDAYNENDQFFVHHPLTEDEPFSFESIKYKDKYFISINRNDGQNFVAYPFICVFSSYISRNISVYDKPIMLTLYLDTPAKMCFKDATEIEAIEVPADSEYFGGNLQVRFRNSTNLMCTKIEISK